jgi:DNA invertase Pin-like site-specific DNA recombinase
MTSVAIYAYTNTPESAALEDQLHVCRSYAAYRGWAVTHVYTDTAANGRTTDRIELQTMLEDAEASAIDVVVLASVDRLGRQLHARLEAAHALASAAVELHSATEGRALPLKCTFICGEEARGRVKTLMRRRRLAARQIDHQRVSVSTIGGAAP